MMEFLDTLEDLLDRGHVVRFRADGWSMHPTIRYGETIIVEPLQDSPVRTGDVLLYRLSRRAIAHRLSRVSASSDGTRRQLVLRGDAAECCDPPIDCDQVLGRVIAVQRRGHIVQFGALSRLWSPVWARALRYLRIARMKVSAKHGT
jgi:hypothetical protein